MTAPAHLPERKPQQPDAQSASEAQMPVMNCVPAGAGKGIGSGFGEAEVSSAAGEGLIEVSKGETGNEGTHWTYCRGGTGLEKGRKEVRSSSL